MSRVAKAKNRGGPGKIRGGKILGKKTVAICKSPTPFY
jgi:hypothetical protein